jgi:hypothetical protein
MGSQTGNAEVVRVSMSCLADYVASGGRSAESRLRPFKFPKRGEGLVRVSYYQPALSTIRAYHLAGNAPAIIARALLEMRALEDHSRKPGERAKLKNNISALEAYRKIYGNRKFKVLKNRRLEYEIGGIVITARPDLWVEEHGTQVLLKIGLARHKRSHIDMVLALLRKAAASSKHRIRVRNIVYLNVASGQELTSSGGLTRFNRTFAAAAREIVEIWPRITNGAPGSE